MADTSFIIKGARLSFPDLWAATEFTKGDGKPRYSATLLLPKDDPQIATIKGIGLKMFTEEFKEKGAKLFEISLSDKQNCCVQDGDRKVLDGYEGMMAITSHRKLQAGPPIVLARDAVTRLIPSDGKPYSGCYVNAKVSFWLQDNDKGKAFRATLEVVQFVRDGEAFSSTAPATTDGMAPEPEEDAASMV